jgi:Skp family chaperone for outer membrane proteins
MKFAHCLMTLIFTGLVSGASALEIPLGGTSGPATTGGTSVGYVDMDRIFQIYPQTQAAKEDYAKQLAKKREQLREKEAQVANLKSRIGVLESTLKDLGNQPSSPADSNLPADPQPGSATPTDDMKQQLETQMAELEEMRKQAERDLAAFQNQQSQMILGKIYQALRDLAQEEQVTLVVDKSSILYGDAAIDLTDKLQSRVRGY